MKKAIIILSIFIYNITSAQLATKLHINDTRTINDLPNFNSNAIRADFKERAVIGVPGSGAYSTNVTFAPWGELDNSGNKNHQLNFNNGGVFYRNANPTDTQWGTWKQFLISDDNGNFGIGTDTPSAKLDVFGELLIGSTASTSGVNAFSIRYDGNETLSNWGSLRSSSATYMAYGVKSSSATANGWLSSSVQNLAKISMAIDYEGIKFLTAPAQATALNTAVVMTEAVRINNSGIGIGSTDPKSKLDLGNNYSDPSTFPNKITLWSGGSNNYFGFGISVTDLDYFSQGNHRFHTGYNGSPGTEKMVITAEGNVGIATPSPTEKLVVRGDGAKIKIETSSGAANYNTYLESNYDSENTFNIVDQGILKFGSKNIGAGTNDSYVSGYYGIGFATNTTTANSANVRMYINQVGNIGIGTLNPQYKLDVVGKSSFSDNMAVHGKIESKEIVVTTTPTADFVFEEDYQLPTLESVEKHIKDKKHLPEIASAKDMEKDGVNVGEFQIKLLQKIEELTLYTIEQNKKILEQSKKIEILEKKVNKL